MTEQYSPLPPGLSAGARVWAYLRDSGGPNQERSVPDQEKAIAAYCKEYGLALVRVFRDVARSGGSVVGRDEFMEMIDLADDATSPPRAVLIWNFARFSRDYNDSNLYITRLEILGVLVHSITDQIPVDESLGRLVRGIKFWSNEEERKRISRDVKRGLKELISKGFSAGPPPRGYMAMKVTIGENRDGLPRIVSKWVPDPVLSEFVKVAWQMRAQGKSHAEITRATRGKLYTSKNCWHSFFTNKSYLGIGKCGDLEVPDHPEPLITWSLWAAVQRLYASPDRGQKGLLNHPRRVGNPSLFSGFAYCLQCGAMMVHSTDKRKRSWRFYLCGTRDRHGVAACSSRRVGAPNAEQQILATVLDQVLTPEYLAEVIEETKKKLDSTAEIERQIQAEQRKLEDLEIGIRRTLDTIEKTGSAAAQERLQQREAERIQVKVELERLSLQLVTAVTTVTPEAMQIILAAWRAQFDQVQESGNVRDIKAWLMQFVSRIDLGYNRARIFYTYPSIVSPKKHGTDSGSLGPLVRATAEFTKGLLLCYNKEYS